MLYSICYGKLSFHFHLLIWIDPSTFFEVPVIIENVSDPLKLELQVVIRCHEGAGNWTWTLRKSSQRAISPAHDFLRSPFLAILHRCLCPCPLLSISELISVCYGSTDNLQLSILLMNHFSPVVYALFVPSRGEASLAFLFLLLPGNVIRPSIK